MLKLLTVIFFLLSFSVFADEYRPPSTPPFLNTYNLQSFGAICNGIKDDTAAIQAWLNKAAANVRLVAPAGTCVFTSSLTTPAGNYYSIEASGDATIFLYTGASTTADLLTINSADAVAPSNLTIGNFLIRSNTVMTGGFALKVNGAAASRFLNITLDGSRTGNGNLCGGAWFNGAAGDSLLFPNFRSFQNCGDGIRVNDHLGGSAGLVIVGGNVGGHQTAGVVTGFASGIHEGGGFGGVTCSQTDVHNNIYGALVDNSIVAENNREFDAICDFDGNQTAGVYVNDTLAHGSNIRLSDWIASTQTGPGLWIHSWISGAVEYNGHKIYNNCGNGILIDDASTYVLVTAAVSINTNGLPLSTPCTTWQGSNPGQGYGIGASVPLTRIWSLASPFGNNAGPYDANTGLSPAAFLGGTAPFTATQTVQADSGAQARLNINQIGGVNAGVLGFQENGVDEFTVGYNPVGTPSFSLSDKTTGIPLAWITAQAGGAMTLGEPASTASITVRGPTTVQGASTAQARLNINQIDGGESAVLGFQEGGVNKFTLGYNDTGPNFSLNDITTGSPVVWMNLSPGGNATLGEAAANVLTIKGTLAAGTNTITPGVTGTGTCTVSAPHGGQLAGDFTAATCTTATIVLTFTATQANGYVCDMHDQTTPADNPNQTGHSQTTATFTTTTMGTGTDLFAWKCVGY